MQFLRCLIPISKYFHFNALSTSNKTANKQRSRSIKGQQTLLHNTEYAIYIIPRTTAGNKAVGGGLEGAHDASSYPPLWNTPKPQAAIDRKL